MRLSFTKESITQSTAAALVVPFRQGGENAAFDRLDGRNRRALSALAAQEGFKGQPDRLLVWQRARDSADRVVVMGIGDQVGDAAAWRRAAARAVAIATRHRLGSIAVYLDATDPAALRDELAWVTEGLTLGAYRFRRHLTKRDESPPPRAARIGLLDPAGLTAELRQDFKAAKARVGGVVRCRDLVNEPANFLGPEEFAEQAAALASSHGLRCVTLNGAQLRERGMNLITAVAQGSSTDARLVHLTYKPADPTGRIALVGKGVTYDTGGLCIKPGKSMLGMKTDMAGAAVVLAAMSALADVGARVEVHGIIPLAENAVNGAAYRPGDVLRSYSGQTVEVINTDAEGRLLLADALAYAEEQRPDAIVDFATLTGSCLVALGALRAGLMATDDDLAERLIAAATQTGELIWRLPLAPELERDLRSDVADLKNLGGRYGGTISAGLFLKRFVAKTPWAHLDIAGPARAESVTPLGPRGGTGYGVLTILRYIETL